MNQTRTGSADIDDLNALGKIDERRTAEEPNQPG
jgi:hypothetical protein